MDERDTHPWYKYFWPWFIIALLASIMFQAIAEVGRRTRLVICATNLRRIGVAALPAAGATPGRA